MADMSAGLVCVDQQVNALTEFLGFLLLKQNN